VVRPSAMLADSRHGSSTTSAGSQGHQGASTSDHSPARAGSTTHPGAEPGATDRPSLPGGVGASAEADEGLSGYKPADLEARLLADRLETAYRDWKGTPYLLGGLSKYGVDCSGFTSIVFRDYFETSLPRTTREQMEMGEPVTREDVAMGDLVFFKTGRTTYHVGVMLEGRSFLHASTSTGVMVSELDDPYWASRYLEARRIAPMLPSRG
jgi:cell wall-associated NlpC family hydrolase